MTETTEMTMEDMVAAGYRREDLLQAMEENRSPLYEIAGDLRAVLDDIEDADGELDDVLERRWDAIAGEWAAKIEACAHVSRELDAEAATIRTEEKRLAARRHAVEARGERLRDYMRAELERVGERRVKTPLVTVAIQASPPRVVVDDEAQALLRYGVEQMPRIDKRTLAAALKAGDADATSIAHLEQAERLAIR